MSVCLELDRHFRVIVLSYVYHGVIFKNWTKRVYGKRRVVQRCRVSLMPLLYWDTITDGIIKIKGQNSLGEFLDEALLK